MPQNVNQSPLLLGILELGGYPDFTGLYRKMGFEVVMMKTMRKALKFIKNNRIDVVVAEFNFQSDFRDRTSQLETLMASIAQQSGVKVIVFYDIEQSHQFKRVTSRFDFFATLSYPIQEQELEKKLADFEAVG